MPGVVFVDGGIGLVERPSGRWLGSTFILPVPASVYELAFAFTFDSVDEHETASRAADNTKRKIRFLDINKI